MAKELTISKTGAIPGTPFGQFLKIVLVAVLFLLLLVGAVSGRLFLTTKSTPVSLNQNLVTLVASSYQAMDAAMVSGEVNHHAGAALTDPQGVLSAVQVHTSPSTEGTFLYNYDLYRVNVFRAWAARHRHDFSTVIAWSTFQPKSVTVSGNRAVVTGTETLHIDATIQNNGQPHHFSQAKEAVQALIKQAGLFLAFGQTNDGRAIISHTVMLSLTARGWAIESDVYWDPLAQALVPDHHSLEGKMHAARGQYTSIRHGGGPLAMMIATYNRQGAISYADTWWNSCNPNYTCYAGQDVDCANFVSQALYDGSGGNLPGDGTWYADSYAFVNANGLYQYLSGNYAAATYSSYDYNTAAYDDAWYDYPGDLVFYDWGNVFGFGNADGAIDHTAITVAQDANGYTYEDAHTNNLYHFYWDLGGGSQTGYFFLVMNG